MGLKKLAGKINEYNERLENGSASKIKPGHVEKTLAKLQRKAEDLKEEIKAAKNADKKARLTRKLGIAEEHIMRAQWLMEKIS